MPTGVYPRNSTPEEVLERRRERNRKKARAYYQANREKMLLASKARYKANPHLWKPNSPESKEHIRQGRLRRSAERRGSLWDYKAEHPCERCGEADPSCLDFHHRDPGAKEFSLGAEGKNKSFKRLLVEIEKCAVLCANCHRKLHYGRFTLDECSNAVQ